MATVTLLFAAGVVQVGSSRATRQVRAIGAEYQERLAAFDGRRPVLHGEARDGLAFDEYGEAVELLREDVYDEWVEYAAVRETSAEAARAARDKHLAGHQPALEALARGARTTDAKRHIDWSLRTPLQTASLLRSRALNNLAVLSAAQHLDAGRSKLALDVLLDGMQHGRDLLASPQLIESMIGIALMGVCGKEAFLKGGLLDRFDASQLARLERALTILEQNLPLEDIAWDGEVAVLAHYLSLDDKDSELFPDGDWNLQGLVPQGYFRRAMLSQVVEQVTRLRDLRDATRDLAWDERVARQDELIEELTRDAGPPNIAQMLPSVLTSRAGGLAQLRLLRAAVQLRLGREAPQLADPFGGQLSITETPEGWTIRSRGPQQGQQEPYYSVELARTPEGSHSGE